LNVNDTPRYASLRDYLRVLRSHRLLILSVMVAFAAAAFLVSSLQKKEYTAQASLSFQDIGSDPLLNQQSIPSISPDQLAAINADLINRPSVANQVKAKLQTNLSATDLQDSVSTEVSTRTNFVVIQAIRDDPDFAARLANGYAAVVLKQDTQKLRSRINGTVNSLKDQLKSTKGGSTAANEDLLGQQLLQQQIAHLETIRDLAQPVQVAKPAVVPSSPSSPRIARNTILGAILGLAFGLLAAFVRDSLDRRLRNTDEVQAELRLPVIGRIPDDALGHAGFANGTVDNADVHLEAFRMLRTNLEFLRADSPLKTVMVTSGLPEEGKSTVAMALAGAAAVAGKRTLLVECDLRRPCFADRLEIKHQPGLTDYLAGQAEPADVLQVVKLSPPVRLNGNGKETGKETEEYANLVCITAGSTAPLPAEMLGSDRFASFLSNVSKAYDIVVLDTSPILSVVDALELAPQVDGLLVCVRLSKTTREQARAARDALAHLPGRPTGVVVTGVHAGDDLYYGYNYSTYRGED
jgi:capsular exopolysaccharide synthesis family protein